MNEEIASIEKSIFKSADSSMNNSFLAQDISPRERIVRYFENPKVGLQFICAKHKQLSFDSDSAHVTLFPEQRQSLLEDGKEMLEHGIKTGRFDDLSEFDKKRALTDIVKGNTGEEAGIILLNAAFECFGLETRLERNKLKYDGRGDGGRDAVIGVYGVDFKYRNDVTIHSDLVVSSFEPSSQCLLIHTHSVRRKDDTNYPPEFYLNVGDSSHIVIVRGAIDGARFASESRKFKNNRDVLDKSKEKLVPVWDLVLFLAIQAAKQEGYIE